MNSTTNIFGYLRYAGVGLIVVSVISYLISGLNSFDDFNRFIVFCALSVTLVGFGIFAFKKLEDKLTARIFVALGLLSVPALSALYGGVIFNAFGGGYAQSMPSAFDWSVSSGIEFMISGVLLLVIGLVNSRFGFMVLNIENIKTLKSLFVVNNLILLIPFRNDLLVLFAAAIFFAEVYYLNKNNILKFKTFDEFVSIFASLAPLFILVGRAAYYSDTSSLITAVSTFMGAVLLYLSYLNVYKKSYLYISAALTCISGLSMVLYIDSEIYSFTQPALVGMLLFTGCMQLVAKMSKSYKSCGEILACFWSFASIGFFIYTMFEDEIWIRLIYILSGVYVAYVGAYMRHKWLSYTGILFSIFMTFALFLKVFHTYIAFNWLSVAFIGVILVVFASFMDKKGKHLISKYNQLFKAPSN